MGDEQRDQLRRVLFVVGSLDPGGSERQLVTLIEATHGTRIDATVAVLGPAADGALEQRLAMAGVAVETLTVRGSRGVRAVRAVLRLLVLARRGRPGVVYSWLEEATLVAAVVARVLRIPLVVARRNVSGPYDDLPRGVVWAIHRAERLGKLVTVNSGAVAEEAHRRGVDPARIRLIPNGCALPALAKRPSGESVSIGYLARMRPEKGHLRLLRALARVTATGDWRAEIAGEGTLEQMLRQETQRLGLSERVRFTGPVAEGAAFWRGQDIAVLLSDHEGSPNALIEAAAAGLPMVGTAVGGIPELIDEGVGVLVDPADERGIAAALEGLIDDGARRASLGAAARDRAVARHSLEAFAAGHCAALDEAARG